MTRRYTTRPHHVMGRATGYYEVLEVTSDTPIPRVLCRCQISLDAIYIANLLGEITDTQRLHALQQLETTP